MNNFRPNFYEINTINSCAKISPKNALDPQKSSHKGDVC